MSAAILRPIFKVRKLLSPLLALSLLAGCTVGPAGPTVTPIPTAAPTPTQSAPQEGVVTVATATAQPSPTPTLTPTSTPTASPTPSVTPTPTPSPTPGPEARYERFILITQNTQTMYVYENGVKIRTIPVSTGIPDQVETMTPAWEGDVGKFVGTFFSFGTWADNAWYLFYHYGSMLIHSAPYLKVDGQKVYQEMDALGVKPLSHGCIRMPPEEAQWFTDWGPQGAHVIIEPLTVKL